MGTVGLGLSCKALAQGVIGTTSPGHRPTTAWTCLAFFTVTAAPSANNACIQYSKSSTGTPKSWGLERGSGNSNTDLLIRYNNAGVDTTTTLTSFLSSGTSGVYAAAVAITIGGSYYSALNGILRQSGSIAAGAITYSNNNTEAGNSGANASPNILLHAFALWNRALAPGELVEVSADPTRFLLFPQDDLLWVGNIFAASVRESIAASDSYAEIMQAPKVLTESLTNSDLYAAAMHGTAVVGESASPVDHLTPNMHTALNLLEVLVASGTFVSAMHASAVLVDTLVLSDAFHSNAMMPALIEETLALVDTYSLSQVTMLASIIETLTLNDVLHSVTSAQLIEAITATDVVIVHFAANATLAEALSLSDSYNTEAQMIASITEALSALDFLTPLMSLTAARRWVSMNLSRREVELGLNTRTVQSKPT